MGVGPAPTATLRLAANGTVYVDNKASPSASLASENSQPGGREDIVDTLPDQAFSGHDGIQHIWEYLAMKQATLWLDRHAKLFDPFYLYQSPERSELLPHDI